MTTIPSTCVSPACVAPTYNAVKIRVNDPGVNALQGYKNPCDNSTYNAVDIEINRPRINEGNNHRYPYSNPIVTADMAGFIPINRPIPIVPVAYNWVNNRTFINAEIDLEPKIVKEDVQNNPEALVDASEDADNDNEVPAPNLTTTEEEKNLSFHGLDKVEIVPSAQIKPQVDIDKVVANLSSKDFDTQALQLEEIAQTALLDSRNASAYIVNDVFTGLINIATADSSKLEQPTEKQIETRKMIILNEVLKEQAIAQGQDPNKIELPFEISETDLKEATQLSKFEQAERNKEYAILTIAMLAKLYTDEVEKSTKNVVPLTDIPGVSNIVDIIRRDKNPEVRAAAIDALRFIQRAEYKDELRSIFSIASKDPHPLVAQCATDAYENLN